MLNTDVYSREFELTLKFFSFEDCFTGKHSGWIGNGKAIGNFNIHHRFWSLEYWSWESGSETKSDRQSRWTGLEVTFRTGGYIVEPGPVESGNAVECQAYGTIPFKINHPVHNICMWWPNFWLPTVLKQQSIFLNTLIEVYSSHLHASFGTFCVQIGRLFKA